MDIRADQLTAPRTRGASHRQGRPLRLIRRGFVLPLILALSSAIGGTALADTPVDTPAHHNATEATRTPVSTSPTASDATGASKAVRADFHSQPPHLPLTRAAARKQTEAISPAAWLAHFGNVEVVRLD